MGKLDRYYQEFCDGSIPDIKKGGFVPASFVELARITDKTIYDRGGFFPGLYHTSDFVVRFGKEVKLVLGTDGNGTPTANGKYLFRPNGTSVYGCNLSQAQYDSLSGEEVFATQISGLVPVLDSALTQEQVRGSLFWRTILRDRNSVPKSLAMPGVFEEFVSFIFQFVDGRRGGCKTAMPLYCFDNYNFRELEPNVLVADSSGNIGAMRPSPIIHTSPYVGIVPRTLPGLARHLIKRLF